MTEAQGLCLCLCLGPGPSTGLGPGVGEGVGPGPGPGIYLGICMSALSDGTPLDPRVRGSKKAKKAGMSFI